MDYTIERRKGESDAAVHMAGMADANHWHFVAEYLSLLAFREIILGIAFSTPLFERACTFQAPCVTHLFL